MPITPNTGSLFHAETQTKRDRFFGATRILGGDLVSVSLVAREAEEPVDASDGRGSTVFTAR
jgi:hypothetical protein